MESFGILRAWQERYGPLTSEQRRRFLSRDELKVLENLPDPAVLKALDLHQKLASIASLAPTLVEPGGVRSVRAARILRAREEAGARKDGEVALVVRTNGVR